MKDGRNPCLNGGICYINYEPQHLLKDYICICPMNYFGEQCEISSATLGIIYFNNNQSNDILVTIVQLLDINLNNIDLHLKKQLIYKYQLPSFSLIRYEQLLLPEIGLVKTYYTNDKSTVNHHLLYIRTNRKQHMNITFQLNKHNYCPHTSNIIPLNKSISGEYDILYNYNFYPIFSRWSFI
jgi:hypothetical protein